MNILKVQLSNWDGKQTDVIGQIYTDLSNQAAFIDDCIVLLTDSELQAGASWLLKRHCDSGQVIHPQQVAAIFDCLDQLQHWQAKLHILQSMQHLPVNPEQLKPVRLFVKNAINDDNKFVRAWAYDGLYQLALQYPEHEQEAREFFEMAMRDEAASVKARIRNILKKF